MSDEIREKIVDIFKVDEKNINIDDRGIYIVSNEVINIFDIEEIDNIGVGIEFHKCEIKSIIDYPEGKTISVYLGFSRCTFEKEVILREIILNNFIAFVDCTFNKKVNFSKITFSSRIAFELSTFKDEFRFINTKQIDQKEYNIDIQHSFRENVFERKAIFFNATFFSFVDFRNCVFNGLASFKNTKFLGFIDQEIIGRTKKQYPNQNTRERIDYNNFREIMFNNRAVFTEAVFRSYTNFEVCEFKKEANFAEAKFNSEIMNNFTSIIFDGKVAFGYRNPKQNIININFENSKFNDDATFKASFNKVNFERITFNGNVNFIDSFFKKDISFKYTSFNKVSFFNRIVFDCQSATFKNSDFSNVTFENWTLNDCYFDFSNATLGNISFKDKNEENIVDKYINGEKFDFTGTTIKGGADFKNSIIKNIKFNKTKFCDYATFENSTFENTNKYNMFFSHSTFVGSAFFNDAKFNGDSNFLNTIFESNLSLYNAEFEKIPNFGGAISNEGINIANAEILKDDIDALRDKIEHECKGKNPKDKVKSIINFRDTFKFLKNGALEENNNFEANKFHKLELYAKEEELNKQSKKPKDWADLIVLKFYRILSDHHTDLLKVFNNLVILIALFFISTFGIIDSKNPLSNYAYKSGENFSIFEYKIENQDKDFNTLVLRNKQTNLQSSLKDKIKNFVDFCIDNLQFFLNVLYLILFSLSYFFITFFIALFDLLIFFILIKKNIKYIVSLIYICIVVAFILLAYKINIYNYNLNFCEISLLNISFICVYIIIINSNKAIIRIPIIFSSYFVLVLIIGIGNLIFLAPILGKLTTDFNPENKLFISLSFTYTLLMFLVLFSFQKTARRNSIVPS